MDLRMISEKSVYQKRVDRARRPNPVKADRPLVVVYRCRICSTELGQTHLQWCDTDAVASYVAEVTP
jgi:hypothetical protein